ncbi:EamA family transporter [Actinomadura madurae]|uniref:EamA family transporter n=1 Tax=Actinomadura madurae TaxID=1993 RepID=UPI002025EA80|nr:EamA family transporter [Actinomadura madurae]MCP9953912.1 EamA family transporter [Actinomadura madurae]MCQ0005309.1 EamA family transporter [Actinomadura madurae]URM99394.1 EamA family transporter [Actinomadura madurae]
MTIGKDVSRRVPAPLLILGSVVSIQAGQACGKAMFGLAGAPGVVVLRLAFAALVLLARRPPLPRRDSLGLIAALGTAIAGMQLIYPAIERLPVGVASTLQFLGPLTLALVRARRPADLVWAALAGTGVVLLYGPSGSPVPLAGAAFALASGACMAGYLVLNKRAGVLDGAPLTWAVAFAAVLVLPLAPSAPDALLRPEVLLAGLGVALLSAVVPWSLDLAALRRLPDHVVAVMVSLEPAAGALAGLVLLGEHLSWASWLAVGCVSAASAGTVLSNRPRPDRRAGAEALRQGGENVTSPAPVPRSGGSVPPGGGHGRESEGVRAGGGGDAGIRRMQRER